MFERWVLAMLAAKAKKQRMVKCRRNNQLLKGKQQIIKTKEYKIIKKHQKKNYFISK